MPGLPRGSVWLKALCCLLAIFAFAFSSYGQNPCPTGNCTSKDVTVTRVEMIDATTEGPLPNSCPSGSQSVSVKLKVTFNVTSKTRYGFIIIGDVYLNGNPVRKVWQCSPGEFTQGDHQIIVSTPFDWPCGSSIELRDVFIAWDNAAPTTPNGICDYLNQQTGALTGCTVIDPKCNYYGSTESFVVAAPLIADFTYSGSCPGNTLYQPITFSSPASGTGATTGGNKPYQYSWKITDVVTSVVVGTSTGSSYTYTPASAHDLSVQLTVTDASTPQGTATVTKIVTATSCCTPPTITSQPADQTKCAGAAASFTVGHSGGLPDPHIQWQVSTDGSTWNNVPGAAPYSNTTSATLNISAVTAGMNNYRYRAVLQSGVCDEVESATATLYVSPTTVGGTVSAAQSVCSGSSPANALQLSGHTGGVVMWQRSTDNFASNTVSITNTSTTLTAAQIGALTQDTWFRAVVKSGVCDQKVSSAVKISVDPASVGGTLSSGQRICTGSQPITNLALSGYTGTVVKWQQSTSEDFTTGVSDLNVTAATLPANTIGELTTTTWFRAVVKSGVCGVAYSAAAKITVDPTTVGGSVSGAHTICSGSQPTGNLVLSGQVGSVVMWQRSTDAFGNNISDIANTSATLTSAQIGTLTQDTWFRAVVKSGECLSVASGTVKITVQQPIANNTIAQSQTICSGNAPALLTGSIPTGGNGNPTYQWQSDASGSFTNIEGATGKDFQPGTLSHITRYRRIVSAGTACTAHASNAVTISISEESVVYSLEGSSYCATAPASGTLKLGGSYPGVLYQLHRAGDHSTVQDPKTGDGAVLTWTGLEAGQYYVKGTGVAPTYCESVTGVATVRMFDCSVFYTLTQGYYGNKNGKSCIGYTPVATIRELLGSEDLVVGTNKWVQVPATDDGAKKLNSVLPGGGTATGLPEGAACVITEGCFKSPTYLTVKQQRINNNLLSQTLTLSLNARWKEGEVLLFPIRSGWLTTQKMTGCQDDAVVVEVCGSNTVSSILMNEKVVQYLGEGATVADLLDLANWALGGTVTAGVGGVPSYGDITEAVDAINKSFDEGRRFLDYYPVKQTCEMLFPAPVVVEPAYVTARSAVAGEPVVTSSLSVVAYPNPFTDKVSFVVETGLSGTGSLELYDIAGQRVAVVYQGLFSAGKQSFEARLTRSQATSLIYVVTIGNKRVTGKVFRLGGK